MYSLIPVEVAKRSLIYLQETQKTYLTISSPSGLPKNPPTSAPTKDIPATEKERHIGTVD